jgi:hypothetical protein
MDLFWRSRSGTKNGGEESSEVGLSERVGGEERVEEISRSRRKAAG